MRTGSPRNVLVKGNAEAEYAWFKISDSLPITSMSAERAARNVIEAIAHRDAERILTFSAKLGSRVQNLFPNFSAGFGAMLNRLLPAPPAGASVSAVRGRNVETGVSRGLGALSDRAARRNNESGDSPS